MNSFTATFAGLFLVYATVITTGKWWNLNKIGWFLFSFLVYCVDLRGVSVTDEERIALTRDHFRREDPDALLNGFFPVWAAIQFLIACE